MTGETRVALLLGLIFIFAFGLVLGEITGTTPSDPVPAAKLRDVEYLAKQPNADDRSPYAPAPPERIRPSSRPEQRREEGFAARRPQEEVDVRVEGQDRPRGRRVVDVRWHRQSPPPDAPAEAERAQSTPPAGARTYKIRKGDTLYGIARRAYGEDRVHEWRRIYQANRDVLPSPTSMTVGTELTIPPLESAPSESPAVASREQEHVREVTMDELAEELRRHSDARRYVTRPGDNLTKIARDLLGDDSPQTIERLFEANRGRLPGPNVVPVGVELTIPSS